MKAVIMAGGQGTRGRPYTDYIPKAMTRLDGAPLIEIIARYISASHKIDEIIIIADLDGAGAQIQNHLENIRLRCGVSFVRSTSSGTAGDLVHVRRRIGKRFLLWFADNLCALDIDAMIRAQESSKRAVCVAVRSARKEETGFVSVDGVRVDAFKEKPVVDLAMPECLGVYVVDASVLGAIRKTRKTDLSYDILQPLASSSQLGAYDIGDTDWIDAESPVVLERNAKMTARILGAMKRRARTMRSRS